MYSVARVHQIIMASTVLAFMLFTTSSQAATNSRPFEIGSCLTIDSKVLHEQRQYCVHLPDSYTYAANAQRHYPVLYMLDGEDFFGTAAEVTDFMSSGTNGNYAIPEMIVVGIVNTNRTRDLTPTHTLVGLGGIGDFSSSGGAAAFLSFLNHELLPQIDHNYRTMPYRILAGHSLAGLAAVDALQNQPQMFQATIAIDPSLWWDNEVMLTQAKTLLIHSDLHNRLYIALANTPSIDGPFANIASVHMNAIRAYAHFMETNPVFRQRFKMDYFPSEEHGSVPLVGLYNGLEFIFEGYKLTFAEGLNHPERIVAHFEKESTMLGTNFPPPEKLINAIGYMALNDLKDPAKAIALFTVNTTSYPQSFNAFDSLGEAYATFGKKTLAILNYKKSLELNSNNTNAKEWLERASEQQQGQPKRD